MAKYEGSAGTGWLILFTRDETERIAKPVGDYAGTVAAAAAFVPEPIVSKIVSAGTAMLVPFAKRATKEGKLLGLYIRGFKPFRSTYILLRLKPSEYPRFLYANSSLMGFTPFIYDEQDPQSLMKWRRAVGM